MKTVWACGGMAYWGRLVGKMLNRQVFIDAPVADCDEVFICGLYDPPYYDYTLQQTKRAKKRHIHFHGTDVLMLTEPDRLPEATYTCDSPWLRDELLKKGVDATVVSMPTVVHAPVTPLPEEPTVSVYLGSNPDTYGAGIVSGLMDVFPKVRWLTYQFGQYGPEEMLGVIRESTVHLRLTQHDGGCVSPREMMEAGRYAVTTSPLEYAKQVSLEDFEGICSALAVALKQTDPDYEAAAYYHAINSDDYFVQSMKEAGVE